MGHKILRLSLQRLRVNPQNPRYRNPRISESDAILALFREIKRRPEVAQRNMLNLIADIVKHGVNPAEIPIVVPDPYEQEVYQVMEGNRRIAALKLLYFPDLAAGVFRSERRILKRLEGLREEFHARFGEQYKELTCVVYQTPEEVSHWILLRHTGENEGRGITPWDKAAKDRFRLQAAERKHTIAMQIVEILVQEKLLEPDVPVVLSTVERMVKDPDVYSCLGIEIINGEIRLSSDSDRGSVLKVLQRIALDTVEKDPQTGRKRLTSRHINSKEERLSYFKRVIDQIAPHLCVRRKPKESNQNKEGTTAEPSPVVVAGNRHKESSSRSQRVGSPTPPSIASVPSRPPTRQDYKKRRQVAAKGIKVTHSTLDHLYQELCKLEAKYPNIGIMGIRAFLEGSLDVFIQSFAGEPEFRSWAGNRSAPFSIPLSTKLERVIDYLERQNALTPNIAQALRKYQRDKHNLLSVNTLQAYLHNPDLEPREETVKYWWDAYHPFFEALWRTYNAVIKQ